MDMDDTAGVIGRRLMGCKRRESSELPGRLRDLPGDRQPGLLVALEEA